jgi:hypothetical protein
MNTESPDPRDIPVLTEAVERDGVLYSVVDSKALHAALVTETLKLADSLLHQAAKDMEGILFERVFDQLRARLPELIDAMLREHAAVSVNPAESPN